MSAVVPIRDLDQLHGFSISTPTPQSLRNLMSLVFPQPVSPMMMTGMPLTEAHLNGRIFSILSVVSSYVSSGHVAHWMPNARHSFSSFFASGQLVKVNVEGHSLEATVPGTVALS